jgi:hypothetical protein
MIAIVHGTCLHCYVLYFANIEDRHSPEPLCTTCQGPLSSLAPHRGLHITWETGTSLRPLHTMILTVMAVQGRDIIRDEELPPLPPTQEPQ